MHRFAAFFFCAIFFCAVVGAALVATANRTNRANRIKNSFIVLPEAIPEAEILSALAEAGIQAKGESSETVFLCDFSEVKEIPLDAYFDHIEEFDPRNDGYAERLRAYYVAEGWRRIFPESANAKKLAAVLAAYPGAELAAPARFNFFPPAVFLFAAALLAVIFSALKPLAGEYFRALRKPFHSVNLAALADFYPRNAACAALAVAAYLLLCIAVFVFAGLLVLPLFLALVLFFPAVYFFYKAEAALAQDKFLPLPISAKPPFRSIVPRIAYVFFAAAAVFFAAHLTASLASGTGGTNGGNAEFAFGPHPTEEEFAAHKIFQESFARRRLSGGGGVYGTYTIGSDGLIEGMALPPER
jgi:hypothetical protein